MNNNNLDTTPSEEQLENELLRTLEKKKRWRIIRKAILILAVICLIMFSSVIWFPIFYISGEPAGQICLGYRTDVLEYGDIVAVYHDGSILMKRVIGLPGDRITLDPQGNMFVCDPYSIVEGANLVELVYQVPKDSYYLSETMPSDTGLFERTQPVYTTKNEIAARLVLCLWPLQDARLIDWGR